MSLPKIAVLYLVTLVAFLAIDLVWLTTATPRIYLPAFSGVLDFKPNLPVAGLFYVLYVVGIVALAIIPGIQAGSLPAALWRGALFGFLAYATYDLTNMATIRDWPAHITIIDLLWGTSVTTLATLVGYQAAVWLKLS
jgi:uncharacterized membrane protein